MSDQEFAELLAAAYALDGPDANRELYARWAETYDSGFIVESRYIYHHQVAALFAGHGLERLGPGDVVVDVGCGTGLAGQSLRRHTDVSIDGIDISPEMLRQAAAKRHNGAAVYRKLIEADLTGPASIDTDTYSGAFSVGTFTHGHVGPDALAEVVRIVRPTGWVALGINAAHFEAARFGAALERLVSIGQIAHLEPLDVPIYDAADMHNPDEVARIAMFEIS